MDKFLLLNMIIVEIKRWFFLTVKVKIIKNKAGLFAILPCQKGVAKFSKMINKKAIYISRNKNKIKRFQ